jgi:hypothetical protein
MSEPKIAREVAEAQLSEMLEGFGAETDSVNTDILLKAVMDGRISFDAGKQEITYALARPLDLKNGTRFEEIALHEATSEDLEYINKGMMVEVGKDSTASVNLASDYAKTTRMIIKLGSVATGVATRIWKRDMVVLGALASFLS